MDDFAELAYACGASPGTVGTGTAHEAQNGSKVGMHKLASKGAEQGADRRRQLRMVLGCKSMRWCVQRRVYIVEG
jgi:hypothetical protein